MLRYEFFCMTEALISYLPTLRFNLTLYTREVSNEVTIKFWGTAIYTETEWQ